MNKESKYTKYLELATFIGLLVGMMAITIHFGLIESLRPETSAGKFMMMIGIFIMMFFVLGFHELGHLITGLYHGFRFELYVVGPLGIRREKDKAKVYLNKNLGYYGGVALTAPREDHKDNAKKFAQVLLAGPISSILFAVICFIIAFSVGNPLGIIFFTGGLISIAIFFATTIPSRTGMFFTDRKRYQRLINPGKDKQVELAILKVIGTFSKDNSYKNMSSEDLKLIISDEVPFIKFFGLFNLICLQLETLGFVEEEVSKNYNETAKKMSKNIVASFDKEVEKFKATVDINSSLANTKK